MVKLIKKFSERWIVTTVSMIIGGLLGLVINQVRPPMYESSATFSVTIDYTQTGALTDIQEDQAMRGVGSIILSDQVIDNTLSNLAKESNVLIDRNDFLENSFLDREDFRWTLRYRDHDNKISKIAVKAWSNSANDIIQKGLAHSFSGQSLLEELEYLKTCLNDFSSNTIYTDCESEDLNSIINSINKLSSQIQAEKMASQGLFYALSISPVNSGDITLFTVGSQRNLLVVSGAIAGFFLSILQIIAEEIKRRKSI